MLRSAVPEPLFRRRHKSRLTQLDCRQCYRPLARVVIHLFTLNVLPWPFMAALLVIGLRALLGTLVEIIPSFPGTQPLCSWSVPGPSYPLIRVLLNFPSLTGSLTGTKPACFFGGLRSRSTSCSRSLFCLASVLLPCSLCQLCVVRVLLISFPSLTGTKPACLTGGFRSRATICSTSFFFLWKLVYECCTLGIHQ